MMKKMKITYREDITGGDAAALLHDFFEKRDVCKKDPATPNQLSFLAWKGVKAPSNVTKGQAAKMIAELKRKVPHTS